MANFHPSALQLNALVNIFEITHYFIIYPHEKKSQLLKQDNKIILGPTHSYAKSFFNYCLQGKKFHTIFNNDQNKQIQEQSYPQI